MKFKVGPMTLTRIWSLFLTTESKIELQLLAKTKLLVFVFGMRDDNDLYLLNDFVIACW